eukprot:1195485-Prorocentrum_minimum.AAC.5
MRMWKAPAHSRRRQIGNLAPHPRRVRIRIRNRGKRGSRGGHEGVTRGSRGGHEGVTRGSRGGHEGVTRGSRGGWHVPLMFLGAVCSSEYHST